MQSVPSLPQARIGLLKLTDAAPVIVAQERGFFRDAGLDVTLSIEPSWANVADKLCYGFLDAAVILPPLALALALGLRGPAARLIVPMSLSLGGNTVTLSKPLAASVHRAAGDALSAARALRASIVSGACKAPLTLGVVHAYSTHNLLLRYWLAAGGIDIERDVAFRVVPPARMVETLAAGEIAGFCAGAPWGAVAEDKGLGETITTSHGIWQGAPEKALAVSRSWSDANPDALETLLCALLRAAAFCDAPDNADDIASLLAQPRYLGLEAALIRGSLPCVAGEERRDASSRRSVFFRSAATFPWRSQALWFLAEMTRWRLLDDTVDSRAVAAAVYRPDSYRKAASALGISVPLADFKVEGEHASPWHLPGTLGAIEMTADRFCDGAIFDPDLAANSPSIRANLLIESTVNPDR